MPRRASKQQASLAGRSRLPWAALWLTGFSALPIQAGIPPAPSPAPEHFAAAPTSSPDDATEPSRPTAEDTETAGEARSGREPEAPDEPFETFSVPRPAATTRPRKPTVNLNYLPPVRRQSAPTTGMIHGTAVLTLFPGLTDLWLNIDGQLESQSFSSNVSLLRGMSGGWDNLGQFRYSSRGTGLQYGSITSDALVGTSGLRVFTPWGGPEAKASVGLGMYSRLRGNFQPGGMQPALDVRWQPRRSFAGGLSLAADSSFRVMQTVADNRFKVVGIAGRNAANPSFEHGIRIEGRVTPGLKLHGNFAGQSGGYQSRLASLGLAQRLGRTTLSLDHRHWGLRSGSVHNSSANLLIPNGRWTTSLRLERFEQALGSNTSTTNSLQATALTSLDPGTFVWLNTNANFVAGQRGVRPNVAVGVSRRLNDVWSLNGEVRHFAHQNVNTIRLSIGRQIGPDWNARLLLGPAYTGWSNGTPDYAVGLQLTRHQRHSRVATGAIRGRVLLDGQPLTTPLTVHLDSGSKARTNSKGDFHFRRLPTGPYGVALDLTNLPAHLYLEETHQVVTVDRSKAREVVFNLRHVTQIRGSVTVGADLFGRVDPTAAIDVLLTATDENGTSHEATTDYQGNYVFAALGPGKYRVRVEVRSLPPDFEVVGPIEQDVVVEIGKPATLSHQIQPKAKKIELSPLTDFGFADDSATGEIPDGEPEPATAPPPEPSTGGGG